MRCAVAVIVMLLGSSAGLAAARLCPESVAAWNRYVSATEARIAAELASSRGFLALDFAAGAAAARRAVRAGEIVVEPMDRAKAGGVLIDVPSGMVHHWRGAILIPGMTVTRLVAAFEQSAPPARQADVLESQILERRPDWMRVSLKLQRKDIATVVYNTEHVVVFSRVNDVRATSASTATKIAEVADVNTPQEHELRAGDDRGFLWRLNAYWRYEQAANGVIAECESITLSRDIPPIVKYVVRPLADRAARESMTSTLASLRAAFPAEPCYTTMIVTTTVGTNAQLKVKVPGVNSLTACPVGAMTPAVLGPMPLLTVPAVGTSGNGVTQVSVDPTGTVSGVTGNTVVVSVDVPLTTWSGRPIGVVVAT